MATLGIDLGGTNARAAVVDDDGRILAVSKTALSRREPEPVAEAIAAAADAAIRAAGVPVHGCGVGVAGQLVLETGVIAVAPNLGWRDVPFGTLLARALGRSVRVVNDLSAAAWGELHAGAGRGAKEVLVVFVGSGVGSAVIMRGDLMTGFTGVAGELGHVKLVAGGRRCGCGGLGCVEAYAGGHNLIAQMVEVVNRGEGAALLAAAGGDVARLNPAVLEAVAKTGDAAAVEIYERAASLLSLAIANQITMLNPERLILGGGVLNNAPGLRSRIVEGIAQYSSETSRAALKILPAALGDDSGIIGAALLAERAPPTPAAADERANAAQLELLEQEIHALEEFSRSVGAGGRPPPPPPQGVISQQAPQLFEELCQRYGELLEVAVKRASFREVATEPSPGLQALAERVGAIGGGPRDIVELHARTLHQKTRDAAAAKAAAVVAEGRMLALELMGHLATFYRRRAAPGAPPNG